MNTILSWIPSDGVLDLEMHGSAKAKDLYASFGGELG